MKLIVLLGLGLWVIMVSSVLGIAVLNAAFDRRQEELKKLNTKETVI